MLRNILWVCGKVTAANLYYQMGRVGWAGLGWACHSLAAEYIGPGLLLLLSDLQCCSPLCWGWPDCHRCRGGVEARDTVCSHSVLAWVSLCFRIRGFLVTAVQPPVTSPGPRLVSTLELVGGWQCRQLAGRVRLHDCRDYLYTSPVSEYWPPCQMDTDLTTRTTRAYIHQHTGLRCEIFSGFHLRSLVRCGSDSD